MTRRVKPPPPDETQEQKLARFSVTFSQVRRQLGRICDLLVHTPIQLSAFLRSNCGAYGACDRAWRTTGFVSATSLTPLSPVGYVPSQRPKESEQLLQLYAVSSAELGTLAPGEKCTVILALEAYAQHGTAERSAVDAVIAGMKTFADNLKEREAPPKVAPAAVELPPGRAVASHDTAEVARVLDVLESLFRVVSSWTGEEGELGTRAARLVVGAPCEALASSLQPSRAELLSVGMESLAVTIRALETLTPAPLRLPAVLSTARELRRYLLVLLARPECASSLRGEVLESVPPLANSWDTFPVPAKEAGTCGALRVGKDGKGLFFCTQSSGSSACSFGRCSRDGHCISPDCAVCPHKHLIPPPPPARVRALRTVASAAATSALPAAAVGGAHPQPKPSAASAPAPFFTKFVWISECDLIASFVSREQLDELQYHDPKVVRLANQSGIYWSYRQPDSFAPFNCSHALTLEHTTIKDLQRDVRSLMRQGEGGTVVVTTPGMVEVTVSQCQRVMSGFDGVFRSDETKYLGGDAIDAFTERLTEFAEESGLSAHFMSIFTLDKLVEPGRLPEEFSFEAVRRWFAERRMPESVSSLRGYSGLST